MVDACAVADVNICCAWPFARVLKDSLFKCHLYAKQSQHAVGTWHSMQSMLVYEACWCTDVQSMQSRHTELLVSHFVTSA